MLCKYYINVVDICQAVDLLAINDIINWNLNFRFLQYIEWSNQFEYICIINNSSGNNYNPVETEITNRYLHVGRWFIHLADKIN